MLMMAEAEMQKSAARARLDAARAKSLLLRSQQAQQRYSPAATPQLDPIPYFLPVFWNVQGVPCKLMQASYCTISSRVSTALHVIPSVRNVLSAYGAG
jgi:hypothetical protein